MAMNSLPNAGSNLRTAWGMNGVRLMISDNHAGLEAARKVIFGGVPWQCIKFVPIPEFRIIQRLIAYSRQIDPFGGWTSEWQVILPKFVVPPSPIYR
jgi:hypothetical protein